jgi:hypothetical protein
LAFGIPRGADGSGFTGSSDSLTEGSVNLYHTTARAAAAAPVQSVNNKTGVISLVASDVGAAASSHKHALADISQSSATSGQVPTWNGTAWAPATPSAGGGGSGAVDGGDYVGVIPSVTISQQPADVSISINQGDTGGASFGVTAANSTGAPVSYQWQRLFGATWSYINGATSSSLTLTGLTGADDGASYRCIVTSLNIPDVASNPASLAVSVITPSAPVITITSQPQAATILSTQSAASFSVSASASTSVPVTYQWQRRTAGSSTWQNVSSGTASTLSLTGMTYQQDNRSSYRCQINAQGASSVYSNTADLIITWAAAPQIALSSASTATSLGSANYLFSTRVSSSSTLVTVADSVIGGSGVTYQWQLRRDERQTFSEGNFGSLAGNTTSRTINAVRYLANSGSYDLRCIITATNYYGTTTATTGVFSFSIASA